MLIKEEKIDFSIEGMQTSRRTGRLVRYKEKRWLVFRCVRGELILVDKCSSLDQTNAVKISGDIVEESFVIPNTI